MTQENYNIVIPSRYGSSRFPGKPLHLLNGKPMILHVVDRALESNAQIIVVATDDERIERLCTDAGAQVVMTDVAHVSGTDRIAEVAARLDWPDDSIIVGLQGDEPATPATMLNQLAENLAKNTDANMATFCVPVADITEYENPNRVKVVRDHRGMALYFSRAPIPARRQSILDNISLGEQIGDSDFPESYVHVGLYAYRCSYLKRFANMDAAVIENEEQLEQLRVLFNGGRIHVGVIQEAAAGVDHPDDVKSIESILQAKF